VDFFQFDADYVHRLCEHDPMIEGHFASYFGDLMLVKLRSRGVPAADIPDLIQETFVRAYETLCQEGGLRQPECLGAFVNTTCHHIWQEYCRRRRFDPLPADFAERSGEGDPESDLMTAQTCRSVRKVLKGLGEKNELLLRKKFYEEEPNEQTSRELGVTSDYLRVLLLRAKQDFKKRYLRRGKNNPNDKKKDH